MALKLLAKISLLIATMAISPAATARPAPADQRLILVTMDGTRWQDVFRGPDPVLVENSHYTDEDLKEAVQQAWMTGPDHGAALMPFLHGTMARQGVLYGDGDKGECMTVSNGMWFSYPGYNEILTGPADDRITSNDKNYNQNVTFLEWLNRQSGFAGSVTAFGTWDVFPYIINDRRSGVPVNPGLVGRYPTDTLTMRLALDALRTSKPRVLYVGLGDTDELAHVGDYDQYLTAMNRDDDFIAELWRMAQADPAYRGRTTLIVTTDHGRGNRPDDSWREHSSARYLQMYPDYLRDYTKTGIEGSNQIWFAAIGPAVKSSPVASGTCLRQNQVAATALGALGTDWHAFDSGAGMPLPFLAMPYAKSR